MEKDGATRALRTEKFFAAALPSQLACRCAHEGRACVVSQMGDNQIAALALVPGLEIDAADFSTTGSFKYLYHTVFGDHSPSGSGRITVDIVVIIRHRLGGSIASAK